MSMGYIKNMIYMFLLEFGNYLGKLNKKDYYYVVCWSGLRS